MTDDVVAATVGGGDDSGSATGPASAAGSGDNSAGAGPAGPNKSPLDILEELLGQAQGGAGGAGGASSAAGAAGIPGAGKTSKSKNESGSSGEPDVKTEAETTQAEQQLQLQADQARQAQEDQLKLQAQLEELKTIAATPAYQARVTQDAQKQHDEAAQSQAGAGFDIIQLDHKKLKVALPDDQPPLNQ